MPGGILSIHGSNFASRGTVTVTIDGHPATISSTGSPQVSHGAYSLASFALGAYQSATAPSSGSTISVRSDGTFDITIKIDPTWSVGTSHVFVATEQSTGQSAQLKITVPQKPALTSCSKSTMTTTLTLGPVDEGQKQVVTAPFALCTNGSGLVNWTASWDKQQAKWLQLPQSGKIQAPLTQQLQLSASAAGLKAGTYLATVTFSSQDSSLKMMLEVTFIVRSSANTATCIQSSTQSLSFTAIQGQSDPAPQKVTLTSCGATGSWSASARTDDGANWLSVGSSSGNLKSKATQDVPIKVSSAHLGAGTYTGQVTFKIGQGMAVVNVTFTIQPSAQSSCISANPPSLTFTAAQGQGDPGQQTITIGNCGSSASWSAFTSTTDGAHWLSISSSNGTLNANATGNISVGVSSANLQFGTYTGLVTFKMGASTATVNIAFTIQQQQQQPCLSINSQALAFTSTQGQGDPSPQTVTLTNCGPAGAWSAAIANGSNWLSLNPANGNLNAGATQDVSVAVSTASLSQNTYNDQIVFTLGSSSVTVKVMLTVQPPPPCIQASPSSISLPSDSNKITLTNCGDTGTWSPSISTDDGGNWLGLHQNGGTLNGGSSTDVYIRLGDTTNLTPGMTYKGHITFTITTSSGAQNSAMVNVSLYIQPQPPCIQANTSSLNFTATQGQGDPNPQTVTLTNCGPNGSWSASTANNSSWLSLNPTSDNLSAGAKENVTVTVTTAGLTPNTYKDQITFTLGSSSVQVSVTLTIQQPTSLAQLCNQSPLNLDFGQVQQGQSSTLSLSFGNCGGQPLNWSVQTLDGVPWVSFDNSKGTIPPNGTATVNVTVNTTNLKPASYVDEVDINSDGGNNHASLGVTVTPPPSPPCITASTSSLNFTATQGQGNPGGQPVTLTNCGDTGTWSASVSTTDGASWLSVNSTSGSLNNGATQDVTVAVSNTLAPGTYTGQVTFTIQTSTGKASVTVNVTFTVSAPIP